ncbi:MAG TPA: 30S ribosomal protein S3 [Chloroflexi bacterium]|jgi:small subunit ribosomal protein S3|nr:30S ribosomal protein S3 [Chloroflexota bacterium]
MGQKVNPNGFRLGIFKPWHARWYADKGYTELVHEDLAIRGLILTRHSNAGVADVDIDRSANNVTVTIHTARPGIIIGKSGQNVEQLRQALESRTGKKVKVNIIEVRQPDVNATLVARNIADQLVKRISFRRAMKQALQRAMDRGAKGIKVTVGGRLGGAEMSRRETDRRGRVPLQTLRADVDYGTAEAITTYGVIGVKVWIYKGDIMTRPEFTPPPQPEPATA